MCKTVYIDVYICDTFLVNLNTEDLYITIIVSEEEVRQRKLANMIIFRLPTKQIEFFDKMAKEFHAQGAIDKPSRNALGKLAIMYLGGVWTADKKRQHDQFLAQQDELEKQRSPIAATDDGTLYTSKPSSANPYSKSKYW